MYQVATVKQHLVCLLTRFYESKTSLKKKEEEERTEWLGPRTKLNHKLSHHTHNYYNDLSVE